MAQAVGSEDDQLPQSFEDAWMGCVPSNRRHPGRVLRLQRPNTHAQRRPHTAESGTCYGSSRTYGVTGMVSQRRVVLYT